MDLKVIKLNDKDQDSNPVVKVFLNHYFIINIFLIFIIAIISKVSHINVIVQ